jgi:hypothetical protein
MLGPASNPTRVSIGSLRRQPGTAAAASTDVIQGLRDGLAGVGVTMTVHRVPFVQLQLPALSIHLRSGASVHELAEALRRAVEAAIRERLG